MKPTGLKFNLGGSGLPSLPTISLNKGPSPFPLQGPRSHGLDTTASSTNLSLSSDSSATGPAGMVTGKAGVKYGLILPQQQQSASNILGTKRKPTVGLDLEDEEETAQPGLVHSSDKSHIDAVNKTLLASHLKKKAKLTGSDASGLDPSIYDYDASLEEIQKQREEEQRIREEKKLEAAQSARYIDALKESAESRKREREIMKERMRLKEQIKEEEEFGPTERIITSAYKRKKEEEEAWRKAREEQDRKDEEEAQKGLSYTTFRSKLLGVTTGSEDTKNLGDQQKKGDGETVKEDEKPRRPTTPEILAKRAQEMRERDTLEKMVLSESAVSSTNIPGKGNDMLAVVMATSSSSSSTINTSDEVKIPPIDPKRPLPSLFALGLTHAQLHQATQPTLSREERVKAARERYFKRVAERQTGNNDAP